MSPPTIRVSAVVLRNSLGHIVTARKRGTEIFMLPGGKPDPGETPPATAVREVREELGLDLTEEDLAVLGTSTAPAANEPGHLLIAETFLYGPLVEPSDVNPAAEIAEIRWLDLDQPLPNDLAPHLRDNVVPRLRADAAQARPSA